MTSLRATTSKVKYPSLVLSFILIVIHCGCYGFLLHPHVPKATIKYHPTTTRQHPILLRQTPSSNSDNEKDTASGNSNNPLSLFENFVHQVTGDESYKFGDLTKKAMSDLTGKDMEQEDYQFGDISKNLANQAGRIVTGDESYQFGDITKSKLAELEKELEVWKVASAETLNGIPTIVVQTYQSLTPEQRKEILVWVIRLAAIALLTFGAVSNVCSSVVLTMAWVRTSLQATASSGIVVPILPLGVDAAIWQKFLTTYTTMKLFVDPLLLVIKAAGALILFLKYVKCVNTIEKTWMSKTVKNYPIVARLSALGAAFTVNNVLVPGVLLVMQMVLGGYGARMLFPVR